jgi:hypothetical protein
MAERRRETGRFDGITEFSELTELGGKIFDRKT